MFTTYIYIYRDLDLPRSFIFAVPSFLPLAWYYLLRISLLAISFIHTRTHIAPNFILSHTFFFFGMFFFLFSFFFFFNFFLNYYTMLEDNHNIRSEILYIIKFVLYIYIIRILACTYFRCAAWKFCLFQHCITFVSLCVQGKEYYCHGSIYTFP